MNGNNNGTYNFKFTCSSEIAENLKSEGCDNMVNKGIVLVKSIEEIKAANISDLTTDEINIKRMLELGIYPFTMADQNGIEYKGYIVDESGCYIGCNNSLGSYIKVAH